MSYENPLTPEEIVQGWIERIFQIVMDNTEGMCRMTWHAWPDAGKDEQGNDEDPYDYETVWWIEVHETLTEIAEAGPDDGSQVFSGFNLNLSNVAFALNAMTRIHVYCEAHDEQPHVSFEGEYASRRYVLEVYLQPPPDAKVGMRMHRNGSFELVDEDDSDLDDDEGGPLDEDDNVEEDEE